MRRCWIVMDCLPQAKKRGEKMAVRWLSALESGELFAAMFSHRALHDL